MGKGYMSRAKRLDIWRQQQLAQLDLLRSSLENEAKSFGVPLDFS